MSVARICKVDARKQIVFGWASVAVRKDGEQIVDLQNDIIDPEDLEDAAYPYILKFRGMNIEHEGGTEGQIVESLVVTLEKLAAMGLPADALPQGWWLGFHIPKKAIFEKVINGEYAMFSVEGRGRREEVQ